MENYYSRGNFYKKYPWAWLVGLVLAIIVVIIVANLK